MADPLSKDLVLCPECSGVDPRHLPTCSKSITRSSNPRDDGATHSEECWRWHPKCVETRIASLKADCERLQRLTDNAGRELAAVEAENERLRAALELIAGAKDVRGCDAIAREALGVTVVETTAQPYPFHCSKCGMALTFDEHVCNAVKTSEGQK